MKISGHLKLFCNLALSFFATGCIFPLPHTRIVRPECEGVVSDVITGKPISNATVEVVYECGTNIITHTDSSGRWMIPGETSWHAVFIAAPPTRISLLPRFEGTHFPCEITIEADGYDKWEWVSWVDKDTIDMLSKPIDGPTDIPPIVDPENARLKPKGEVKYGIEMGCEDK